MRLVVAADAGIDVERCAQLSRSIGARLDAADPIDGRYTLEVTSPGATRPLRTQRDFARNLGRDVRLVTLDDGVRREVTGLVSAVDADTLTLDTQDGSAVVALDAIDHGRVLLPW